MLFDQPIEEAAVKVPGQIVPRGAGQVVEVEAERSWLNALAAELVTARLDAIKASHLRIANGAGDLSKVRCRRLTCSGVS